MQVLTNLFPGLVPEAVQPVAETVLTVTEAISEKLKQEHKPPVKSAYKPWAYGTHLPESSFVDPSLHPTVKKSDKPNRPIPYAVKTDYHFFDSYFQTDPLYILPVLTYTEPTTDWSGHYTFLNGISNGNGQKQRIGDVAVIKSINIRFTLVAGTQKGDIPVAVRWVLFYDRDTNGSAPALTELFGCTQTTNLFYSTGIEWHCNSRFSVIRDKFITLSAVDPICQINEYIPGEWYTFYVPTASQTPSIIYVKSGAIFFVIFQNDYTFGECMSVVMSDFFCRLRFADSNTIKKNETIKAKKPNGKKLYLISS